jgi:hypothetical protein
MDHVAADFRGPQWAGHMALNYPNPGTVEPRQGCGDNILWEKLRIT